MLKFWISGLCLGCMIVHAQLNVELIGNLDYAPQLNDIWGYVDKEGTEYALVGLTTGFSIVSLADPSNPTEVQFIPGAMSIWRDIKTRGDFAYVVADQGTNGLLIVDLSSFPQDTAHWSYWSPDIPGHGVYHRAHNIWIDEYGLAYLSGSNIGGLIVLDVKPDPWDPDFILKMPLNYAHDAYARDRIVYTAEIFLGQMRVFDISNVSDVKLLGSVTTPFAFTHNTWLSDDGLTAFTTDERANAFIGAYDVSDPADIRELDRFRPNATVGKNVIPHNVHVWNDYLIISYYTDGCIIVDAARPDNLIEVGNFDTFLQGHGGFNGAWGAYPFLPSGNVLISDMQGGLFVLGPNYVRACYLEGRVVDIESGHPVNGVQVQIHTPPGDDAEVLLPIPTNVQGLFKTGKAVAGTYTITFQHPNYYPFTLDTTFVNGEVVDLFVQLTPLPRYSVTGTVRMASNFDVLPFAYVAVENSMGALFTSQADAQGQFFIDGLLEGDYRLYAGNWGHYTTQTRNVGANINEDIIVTRGYYDDFISHLGWTVTGTSAVAHWVRDIPQGQSIFGQIPCGPDSDIEGDFGETAFVTGNDGGTAEDDSVMDGYTMLSSPPADVTHFNDPVLAFIPWLCVQDGLEDVYFVLLSNGTDTVTIDTIRDAGLPGRWQERRELSLLGHLAMTNQMQVHFLVSESPETENVVKAAVDVVEIFDASPTSVTSILSSLASLHVYPNPLRDMLHVDVPGAGLAPDRIVIRDLYGRSVQEHAILPGSEILSLHVGSLHPGMYVVCALEQGRVVAGTRIVVAGW